MNDWMNDEPTLTAARTAQIRAALLQETIRPQSHGRGHLVGLAVMATATLALAGTATALVIASRPADPNEGYCATRVSADPDAWSSHRIATATDDQGRREPLAGVGACAEAWRMGILSGPGTPAGTVPELTACIVGRDLVVFPGDPLTCQRLGVPSAIPGP